MAALLLSTIAFFVAAFFLRRWLEDMDIPAGMTRNTLVFVSALLISYAVAWLVGLVTG